MAYGANITSLEPLEHLRTAMFDMATSLREALEQANHVIRSHLEQLDGMKADLEAHSRSLEVEYEDVSIPDDEGYVDVARLREIEYEMGSVRERLQVLEYEASQLEGSSRDFQARLNGLKDLVEETTPRAIAYINDVLQKMSNYLSVTLNPPSRAGK